MICEYIVDCDEVACGDGKKIVLPMSINGHVHERLIRCRDCRFYDLTLWPPALLRHECTRVANSRHFTEPDGFCHKAQLRGGDR